MGNVPSHEPSRRAPHKLSKPKTGNFTTAGLLSPNGYSNTPRRLSNPSDLRLSAPVLYPYSPAPSPTVPTPSENGEAVGDQPADNRASLAPPPPPLKEQRRRSLFRSKSSQGAVQQRNQRRNTIIGTPATAEKSLPRANSMTYESSAGLHYGRAVTENWPPAGSRASWTYDLNSYEAQRLLNLVQEPLSYEPMAAVSENQATGVSETTWKSSHPAQPESVTITRANSDLSLYTPVRRRSVIQTPGVATRAESTPAVPSRANFRHSHPPTPSMSRKASFESNSSRVLSMPPPPRFTDAEVVPRVVTPCEGDYKTIGAFKLGSLRITNGSPVQSPQVTRTHKREESGSSSTGDYFSKKDSPSADRAGGDEGGMSKHKPLPPLEIPKPVLATLSPVVASFLHPDNDKSLNGVSAEVTEITADYLAEMRFTPFALDEKSPVELQTTSKHTAMEDNLFEDDGQLEYSAVEVLDVRLDLNAKSLPPRPAADPTQRTSRSIARSDSGFVSSPTSDSSRSLKPLAKADSGYSSSVSLRSFQGNTKPPIPDKDGLHTTTESPSPRSARRDSVYLPDLKLPSPIALTTDHAYPAPPQRDAPPPPPPKDQSPTSPRSFSKVVPLPSRESGARLSAHASILSAPRIVRKAVRRAPSPISSNRNVDYEMGSPASSPLSPASAKSDASASALSIGSASPKTGKLHRLLSLSNSGSIRMPLTVHVTHAMDKIIPSVPQHVEARLHEHTGLFPITTKRLALKTQLSKDTLKTIFSVGSLEVPKDEDLPPLPALPDADIVASDTKESALKHALHAVPSTIAHAAVSVIPTRKPIARKPVPSALSRVTSDTQPAKDEPQIHLQPEGILPAEAELTTYFSINNSLGNNAYDAAIKAMEGANEGLLSPSLPDRAMSLTTQLEGRVDTRTYSLKPRKVSSQDDLTSQDLPSPLMPPKKGKTPPPVSMRTRRPVSLRMPPPLRPQSTPPGAQSLTRKISRESIHSYPPAQQPVHPVPRGVDLTAPPIPPLNLRRSLQFSQPRIIPASQYRSPNWEVQTDHDPLAARRSSVDRGRHNSLSSSSYGNSIQRPTSAQPQVQRQNAPPLRHRASYDGYSNQQHRVSYPSHPAPNLGPRSQTQQFDPWSNPQFTPHSQQWDQYGRYPPYVPRGHYRNRSMGSRPGHNGNPPYRILHSYNSPAYRGAPIWG